MSFYSLLIPDYASLLLPFLPATDINSLLLTAKQVKLCFGKEGTKVEMERWKERFPLFNPEEEMFSEHRIVYLDQEQIPSIIVNKSLCCPESKKTFTRVFSYYVLGLNAPSPGLVYGDHDPICIYTENAEGLYIRRANFYINHFPDYTRYMEITPATVVWYNKKGEV